MNYLRIGLLFALAALLNAASPWLLQRIAHLGGTETAIASTLWCLSLFLGFGWACSKVAEGTIFPSFTIQLLIGIVLHDALAPLSVELALAVEREVVEVFVGEQFGERCRPLLRNEEVGEAGARLGQEREHGRALVTKRVHLVEGFGDPRPFALADAVHPREASRGEHREKLVQRQESVLGRGVRFLFSGERVDAGNG